MHVIDALSKRVTEVAAHTREQMSGVVGTISQQLEKEIEVAAVSAAVMSERHTRSAVERLRNELKAHMHQTRADLEKRQEETQQSIAQVGTGLEEVTKQLNSCKPASAKTVGSLQEILSKEVGQKISVSEQKIGELSQSVENKKKSIEDTNELLRDLMT